MGTTIQSQFSTFVVPDYATLRLLSEIRRDETARALGAVGRNDGGQGVFYWDPDNLTADDNLNIIRPTAIGVSDPGRWVRVGGAAAFSLAYATYQTLRDVDPPDTDDSFAVVLGGLSRADGLQGTYYWSETSTGTDNGYDFIRPTSVGVGDPGRWIRVNQSRIYQDALTTAASLRALSSLPAVENTVVYLLGTGSRNDGNHGRFYWDPAATAADDGLDIITPTDVPTGPGRWVRISGGVPAGATMMWWTATAPSGWLLMDDTLHLRTDEPRLFGVLGTTYGDSGSGLDFRVPDPRGRFIRGTDLGAARDPDRASRTDRGDGTTGDAVGTLQDHEFEAHTHDVRLSESTGVTTQADRGATLSVNVQTGSAGGNETRPLNINANFIIKR